MCFRVIPTVSSPPPCVSFTDWSNCCTLLPVRNKIHYTLYIYNVHLISVPSLFCSQAVSKPVWHIQLLCLQRRTPDDGQRNCPKHVEFYSKNKFEKLVQAVSKPVWHIPLLCVQRRTPDDGQRNCPKHVEFYSKNKFEKLVHLVGFSVRTETICFLLVL